MAPAELAKRASGWLVVREMTKDRTVTLLFSKDVFSVHSIKSVTLFCGATQNGNLLSTKLLSHDEGFKLVKVHKSCI